MVFDHKTTTITVVGYEPPEGQQDLQFVGSGGFRNDKTYTYAKVSELDELIDRSKGILRIQNTDHSCMARAIVVGCMLIKQKGTHPTEPRISGNLILVKGYKGMKL